MKHGSWEFAEIPVVATEACPESRVYIHGSPARVSNVKVKCEAQDDGSVKVVTTYDVEYEPVYHAVIRLDE